MKNDIDGIRQMIAAGNKFTGVKITESAEGYSVSFVLKSVSHAVNLVSQIRDDRQSHIRHFKKLESAFNAVKSTGFHGIIQMRV
jgi:hypothetical protein